MVVSHLSSCLQILFLFLLAGCGGGVVSLANGPVAEEPADTVQIEETREQDLPLQETAPREVVLPEIDVENVVQDLVALPDVIATDQVDAPDIQEIEVSVPVPISDCKGLPGAVVSGRLYQDCDETSVSINSQGYYPKFDEPIDGWSVSLINGQGEWSAESCADGFFGFGEVGMGTYILEVGAPEDCESTSSNHALRFPQAVREGLVTIVTIGDSVPKVGPKPLFPARLANLVSGVATVDNRNIAVSGTMTKHWQPGGNLFENVLSPELKDADVVVISIGGNDVMAYIGGSMGSTYQMLQKVEGLDEYTTELHNSVANIINEIQARAPHVDIVFCLYVNYANASYWANQVGPYKDLFAAAGHNALVKARGLLASMDRVLIADMFGALAGGEVDSYLIDAVHLSGKGHVLYADQLFMVLGGLAIDGDHEPVERLYGFSW
jgi:lysophospholipase L1-like esterase